MARSMSGEGGRPQGLAQDDDNGDDAAAARVVEDRLCAIDVANEEEDEINGGDSSSSSDSETDHLLRPKSSTPNDRLHSNYLVFYLLGATTLLPWNFFISVSSFWDYKFRDVGNVTFEATTLEDDGHELQQQQQQGQTQLQKEFASFLAIASNVPTAVCVILSALFGQRFLIRSRIIYSLCTVVALFAVLVGLSKTDSDRWQHQFLALILALVVLINCFSAPFQGAVFGLAGKFPARYMGAVMAGQAMGGIFPAVVNIVVIAVRVEDKNIGFACFLIATLVLLVSLVSFNWMRHTVFYRFHALPSTSAVGPALSPSSPSSLTVVQVVAASWQYCVSAFLVFMTTLAVFPAVTVLVVSEYRRPETPWEWPDRYFTPVTCFLLFNAGDYAGRVLASCIRRPRRTSLGKTAILLLSLARVSLVPLLMLCNAAPAKRQLPIYFHSDYVYLLLMVIFSVSNGYLGNICMLHGPKAFESSQDQELTAMILVAFLVLGASTGSFLSYPIVGLL